MDEEFNFIINFAIILISTYNLTLCEENWISCNLLAVQYIAVPYNAKTLE
jgi:hypothetical protein